LSGISHARRTISIRSVSSATGMFALPNPISHMSCAAEQLTDVTSGHDVYCRMFLELPLMICPTFSPHKSFNTQANHQISPTKDPKRPFVAISATG
jgi:hypothetical protein